MAKSGLSVNVKITGLNETMRKLKELPEQAYEKIIDASWEISQDLAKRARTNMRAAGRQYALETGTVATGEKTLPSVSIGGTSRLTPIRHHGKKPVKAYQVLFGAEFGATLSWRFKPRNATGYAFYPAVDSMRGEIDEKWNAAAQKAIDEFCAGG